MKWHYKGQEQISAYLLGIYDDYTCVNQSVTNDDYNETIICYKEGKNPHLIHVNMNRLNGNINYFQQFKTEKIQP